MLALVGSWVQKRIKTNEKMKLLQSLIPNSNKVKKQKIALLSVFAMNCYTTRTTAYLQLLMLLSIFNDLGIALKIFCHPSNTWVSSQLD